MFRSQVRIQLEIDRALREDQGEESVIRLKWASLQGVGCDPKSTDTSS